MIFFYFLDDFFFLYLVPQFIFPGYRKTEWWVTENNAVHMILQHSRSLSGTVREAWACFCLTSEGPLPPRLKFLQHCTPPCAMYSVYLGLRVSPQETLVKEKYLPTNVPVTHLSRERCCPALLLISPLLPSSTTVPGWVTAAVSPSRSHSYSFHFQAIVLVSKSGTHITPCLVLLFV